MEVGAITSVTLFAIGVVLLKEIVIWLRYKIPKTVRCWFCHNKSNIPYELSNQWYCPSCDQYNGFTKDGDYNQVILGQYEEKLNTNVTTQGRCKNGWKRGNTLCANCNQSEELKLKLLAEFTPIDENNYATEIEHYKSQLEKCYKLCRRCDQLLNNIFKNERHEFSMPRKLGSTLRSVKSDNNVFLVLNLLFSFCIALVAYGNVMEFFSKPVRSYLATKTVVKYLKNISAINATLNIIPNNLAVSLCQIDSLIVGVMLLNIAATYKKMSLLLVLNCISWAVNLLISGFKFDFGNKLYAIQAVSGLISCLLSTHFLFKVNKTYKSKIEPKLKSSQNFFQKTSTPSDSPMSFTQFENDIHNSKNDSFKTTQESLEPRIRDLKIGTPLKSKRNGAQDDVSNFWWSNSCTASSVTSNSTQKSNFKRNILSPTRFANDLTRPATFMPLEIDTRNTFKDIDSMSNLPDDCLSCTSRHSQCHHHCPPCSSYPPPYYPPFQTFNTPPYQQSSQLLSSAPFLVLMAINAGLLYIIGTKHFT